MARKLKKKQTQVKKIVKKVKKSNKVARQVNAADKNLTYPTGEYFETVGRRKVATARVRLFKSKGDFIVNDKLVSDFFASVPMAASLYNKPFHITNTLGKFTCVAKVSGSGTKAQLQAVVHGIARALVKINPDLRAFLKEEGLLTRDDRMKETRKIGKGGKARRKRQSPKR